MSFSSFWMSVTLREQSVLFSQLENTDFVVLRLADVFFGGSVLERRCVVEGIRCFFSG